MHRIRPSTFLLAGTLLTIAFGCSKEELGDLVDKAKDAASDGTKQVKEAVSSEVKTAQEKLGNASDGVREELSMAGTIELTVGIPVKTDACYAKPILLGPGRPLILQLRSYRDPKHESFPSILLHCQVEVATPSELVGRVVPARLFLQREVRGPVLFSKDGSPVELRIVSLEEGLLSAELVTATLFNTETGESIAATGRFEAVLP